MARCEYGKRARRHALAAARAEVICRNADEIDRHGNHRDGHRHHPSLSGLAARIYRLACLLSLRACITLFGRDGGLQESLSSLSTFDHFRDETKGVYDRAKEFMESMDERWNSLTRCPASIEISLDGRAARNGMGGIFRWVTTDLT